MGPRGPQGIPGPSGPPSPPDRSVQFDDDGVFGGSDDVAISDDSDEVLVSGLNNTGPIPVTGNLRIVAGPIDGNGWIARFRSGRTSPSDERDVGFFYAYSSTSTGFTGEKTVIGTGGWNDGIFPNIYQADLCPDAVFHAFNDQTQWLFTTPTPNNDQNALALAEFDQAGPVMGFDHRRIFIIQRYTNLLINPTDYAPVDDALCNGEGVVVWGKAVAVPTTNPSADQIVCWIDPTEHRPYLRDGSGNIRPMYALTGFVELDSDQLTISDTFSDVPTSTGFMSVTVSTQSGVLDIIATAGAQTAAQPGYFRLTIDGSPIPNGGAVVDVGVGSMAIAKVVTGLAVGNHTVTLQWKTAAVGGTLFLSPSSNVELNHASLLVRPSS